MRERVCIHSTRSLEIREISSSSISISLLLEEPPLRDPIFQSYPICSRGFRPAWNPDAGAKRSILRGEHARATAAAAAQRDAQAAHSPRHSSRVAKSRVFSLAACRVCQRVRVWVVERAMGAVLLAIAALACYY